METFRFAPAYELPTYPFEPPADLGAARRRRYPVVIVGGRAVGPDARLRPRATRRARRAARRGRHRRRARRVVARHLLCAKEPRDLRPARHLRSHHRQGRDLVGRQNATPATARSTASTCRPTACRCSRRSSTCSSSTSSGSWSIASCELARTDLRWKNRVTRIDAQADHVRVAVDTPSGAYELEADYLIDASGAHSPIRAQLGLDAHVSRSTDRWCISDVRFEKPLPVERWTWVDAPFNEGRAVWQHLMGDERLAHRLPDGRGRRPRSTSAGPRSPVRGCAASSGRTWSSSSCGSGRTSTATTCSTSFAAAACSSSATLRMWSARSARAAATPASRTPRTSAGSSRWCCRAAPTRRCSTATTPSGGRPPRRTCRSRAALRASSRRARPPSTSCAARSLRSRAATRSRGRWSTPAACRCRTITRRRAGCRTAAASVQNIAFDGTSVMRLLRDGTRFVGLWFSPRRDADGATRERSARDGRWSCASSTPTARSPSTSKPGQSTCVLIRPDAYRAASIDDATPQSIEAALRAALSKEPPGRSQGDDAPWRADTEDALGAQRRLHEHQPTRRLQRRRMDGAHCSSRPPIASSTTLAGPS